MPLECKADIVLEEVMCNFTQNLSLRSNGKKFEYDFLGVFRC